MNTNQKILGNGSPVPILAVIGLGVALVNWLLSDDDTEKKPETAPANIGMENRRKEPETTRKTPVFRTIPAEIPVKPAPTPAPAIIPPFSVPPVPKVSAAVPAPQKIAEKIPPPVKGKFITRQDMAAVFHGGTRTLSRTAAVMALKNLGFGKTAAYAALSPDGRFSTWLQCAPDGIITWQK